ncbi:unnamed protein product [Protopolystoma xenopodis]|uniref:Uncharacterized protein n=1 Tax=Protopolystoma xenopodis TaxID=117903 RepID=A0A448X5A2_9PLAT|nr:unnamed protein product [Protopolystoma xenopodis]
MGATSICPKVVCIIRLLQHKAQTQLDLPYFIVNAQVRLHARRQSWLFSWKPQISQVAEAILRPLTRGYVIPKRGGLHKLLPKSGKQEDDNTRSVGLCCFNPSDEWTSPSNALTILSPSRCLRRPLEYGHRLCKRFIHESELAR